MGTYRFMLSILVLLSHVGITLGEINPGVSAVISFFLISGYTMNILFEKFYNQKKYILHFFIDRAMRIFPLAWVYMVLTLILISIKNVTCPYFVHYLDKITFTKMLNNFLILPLGYYMLGLEGALIVPQAWTLGLELTFYLLFPIIFWGKASKLVGHVSFGVFLLAYFNVINNDYFSYRLIFGTLFIFLIGAKIKEINTKQIIVMWLIVLALFVNTYINAGFNLQMPKSVLLGLLLGLPAIKIFSTISFRNKYDDLLGNLSYGIYLNHFMILFFFDKRPENIYELLGMIICSIVVASITNKYIEIPKEIVRKRYRKKHVASQD